MTYTMDDLVKAVRDHAYANYEKGGWDVVIETYDTAELVEHLTKAGADTPAKAIESFRDLIDVWSDRQADARQYGDDWAGGY